MGIAVVGGGISGISAALDLARSGFTVYLIEKNQKLGGKMSELAECKVGLVPLIAEVENHPNIELLLSSELEALSGSAGNFKLTVSGKEIAVESVVLAPGYELFEAISRSYSLDHPDVVTSLEFERMLRAATKTGELLRPSNDAQVKRIGFIQCVGSRCTENEQCSTVCCAYTAKEAWILKRRFPDVDAYIFYMDLRVFGKDEALVEEITNRYNVKYIQSRVPEVVPEGETLTVKFEDFEQGSVERLDLDMVVLAVGLRPSRTVRKLAEITGVKTDGKSGYVDTSFTKPLETNVPGIFVCGTANAPMKVWESVAQGSAAALKASLLSERVERLEKDREVVETEAEPRIGVFICGCAGEIGNSVDISAVVERVKDQHGVVYVNGEMNTCEDVRTAIERDIRAQRLNRVVFAGCTPRGHEELFRGACAKAGLNPYLLEIANIREHCAWVHEREEATEVAGDLITMAVERARHLEDQPVERYPVTPKALVIGGGAAGMSAALDIATAGYDVYLVEKEPKLGGLLNTITNLLTGESASDVLNSLVAQIKDNARVTVYTNAEVADVWGRPGGFKARIHGDREDAEIEFGVAVLATVASESVPEEGYFGYGHDKNVVTQSEFAKMLKDGTVVENASAIVMIQEGTPGEGVYQKQNSINVVTNALRAKKLKPESNVFVLHQEIKTYGKWELVYREARERGVIFLRYDKERPPEVEDGIISVHEVTLNDDLLLQPDLVVLSTLMKLHEGHEHLSELFKIPLDENGFFLEARERPRMNLTPVDTPNKGVFICGSAIYPTTLDECFVLASAAASRACGILSKEFIESEPQAARVNETLCRGCGLCEQICEYGAITLKESGGLLVAEVNDALCKGCGACAVACPARAITCKYSSLEQIRSMIEAIT
ncbi:MAG TPA: FAD-dependent oxidoreductase [Desulfobacteria bacterium]|nr:FAD-dependent oxidoreductase [Desulfobacteria bacterium]